MIGRHQLSFGVICSQHRDSAPKDGVFIMTNHPADVTWVCRQLLADPKDLSPVIAMHEVRTFTSTHKSRMFTSYAKAKSHIVAKSS